MGVLARLYVFGHNKYRMDSLPTSYQFDRKRYNLTF